MHPEDAVLALPGLNTNETESDNCLYNVDGNRGNCGYIKAAEQAGISPNAAGAFGGNTHETRLLHGQVLDVPAPGGLGSDRPGRREDGSAPSTCVAAGCGRPVSQVGRLCRACLRAANATWPSQ